MKIEDESELKRYTFVNQDQALKYTALGSQVFDDKLAQCIQRQNLSWPEQRLHVTINGPKFVYCDFF